MGEPVEEYEEGNNCAHCWGIGKEFGDYATPKRVYMTGAGFVGGAGVCNGTFIATQDPVSACKWSFDDGTRNGSWILTAVASEFKMGISGGSLVYNQVEFACKKFSTTNGESVTIS